MHYYAGLNIIQKLEIASGISFRNNKRIVSLGAIFCVICFFKVLYNFFLKLKIESQY